MYKRSEDTSKFALRLAALPFAILFAATLVLPLWFAGSADATGVAGKAKTKNGTLVSSKEPVLKSTAKSEVKGLHRLDFVLTHASCPSCILKVRAALRATSGVQKCEIALRKPYGGALIYSPSKVTIDALRDIATKADPNKIVEFSDILEKPVDSVPEQLVPSYMFRHE